MPIADWSVAFDLTSLVYSGSDLPINQPHTFDGLPGIYLLRQDGCSLSNTVRSTKENIPQSDGAILHRRYLAGMEMTLAIQLWQSASAPACDDLQHDMLDTLMGFLYGLLNAGDNAGRITWVPASGNARMLDDLRLLGYPTEVHPAVGPMEVGVVLDCALPYAEELTPEIDSVPGTATNGGNRPTFPVFRIWGPYDSFDLANTTTGFGMSYDGSLPGAQSISGADYIEINTFTNTAFLNGDEDNVKAGLALTTSEFFSLAPGANVITLTYGGGAGGASVVEYNYAWA